MPTVPVRHPPTPSRSRHFGGVSERKTRSDHVTRKALAGQNNETYEKGNGIMRVRLTCVQSPPPPQPPIRQFFLSWGWGGGRLYTGHRKRIIHLQTVPQN